MKFQSQVIQNMKIKLQMHQVNAVLIHIVLIQVLLHKEDQKLDFPIQNSLPLQEKKNGKFG